MVKWDDDICNTPAYPVTDGARYLRITLVTLNLRTVPRDSIYSGCVLH